MFDFYVINGKKLIDYKPKRENYTRAYIRLVDSMQYISDSLTMLEMKESHTDDFKRTLFLMIKLYGKEDLKILDVEPELVAKQFSILSSIDSMVGLLTPREFMELFPIEKDFDGAKYECKDYFYTMNYVKEFGVDTVIGDKASEFLMEYCNWDINEYMCYWMGVVNRMHMLQGGKDILLEFMEEQGVTPRTFHSNGEYMVDDETGEKFKIKKPQSKLKKTFLGCVGGA